MGNHHIPDLDAIQNTRIAEIQFYAAIGAVVSLAAALDFAYLDVFAKATSLKRETAGEILFRAKNSSLQRDMAFAAMTQCVSGDGVLSSDWKAICERVTTATGQSGLRHLVAHNTVTRFEFSGAIGDGPIGAGPIAGGPEVTFHVFRDQQRLLFAGKSKGGRNNQAEIHSLLKFARQLIGLLDDLERFLARVP